jgi:hypothetical protein
MVTVVTMVILFVAFLMFAMFNLIKKVILVYHGYRCCLYQDADLGYRE